MGCHCQNLLALLLGMILQQSPVEDLFNLNVILPQERVKDLYHCHQAFSRHPYRECIHMTGCDIKLAL